MEPDRSNTTDKLIGERFDNSLLPFSSNNTYILSMPVTGKYICKNEYERDTFWLMLSTPFIKLFR